MKIRVYSRKIKKKEVAEFINLLPDRYKNLDVRIELYGSRLHLILSQFFNKRSKHKDACGDFFESHNLIRCFLYKFSKNKYFKINIFGALLHEIRHKYQSVYFTEKYYKDQLDYIPSGENYLNQWIEKDAYRFARRVMNLYKDKINEIIGFDEDWRVHED